MVDMKSVRPFFFQDHTHQEVADLLDQEYPISLKHNEDLVNRVYLRYPILKKSEVAVIIRQVFQGFRTFLILGKTLGDFLGRTRLVFSKHAYMGTYYPSLKIKVSTSTTVKND